MTQERKHYSKKFKIDAVKMVTEQGYQVSEAARNLGRHLIRQEPDASAPDA